MDGAYILKTLVELLADQEEVIVNYQIKEKGEQKNEENN